MTRSLASICLISLIVAGCSTVPYTGRRQLRLVPEGQEMQLGEQAFAEVKSKSNVSKDSAATGQVQRVGERIAMAAKKPDFKWEFTVIDEPKTVNAFCLPGGKVAVYTGLLPVAKDDTGLAVVMAHEVAHALAGHGQERMSEQMLVSLAGGAAAISGIIKTQQGMQAVETAYGIGRALPHSRKQESEADEIGLMLMAEAGYDPRGAVPFWERMRDAAGEGGKPPEFLSTHPSDETRIRNIQKLLPKALERYQPK